MLKVGSVPAYTVRLKQMIVNLTLLLLSSLCIIYAGLNAYALIYADGMIFPAPLSSYQQDAGIFKLPSRDGETIATYHLPAAGAQNLLLYSHGNGEDIGLARPFLELFTRAGIAVLAYDYPGYGTSSGRPSEAGTYAAIEAAYRHATETLGYRPEQITLYGRSLGSGPSSWLAEREPVAGLILDGAFTSTFRVLTGYKLLPWDKFDNHARLSKIRCPILIIHGTLDQTVPFSHALKNWKRIEGPKHRLFVEGAHHGNVIELAGREYWDTVLPFIQGNL
jgi:pimeloyl-ACP methyl ester carboxylesterase